MIRKVDYYVYLPTYLPYRHQDVQISIEGAPRFKLGQASPIHMYPLADLPYLPTNLPTLASASREISTERASKF